MPKITPAEKDLESAQANASNVLKHIIDATEGQSAPVPDTRNAAAVALGKLGAAKGGFARAKALSKSERSKIARVAAKARWQERKDK
jgi:hypothetical protein